MVLFYSSFSSLQRDTALIRSSQRALSHHTHLGLQNKSRVLVPSLPFGAGEQSSTGPGSLAGTSRGQQAPR